MRILASIFLLLISIFTAAQDKVESQQKEKWKRVYTYEDSIIEMNATKVDLADKNIARVIFRTVWSKPQNIREKPGVKFKSRVETIEYKCAERRFRIYQVTLLDAKGGPVDSYRMDQAEEWKTAKPEGIMQRLMGFACSLIREKQGSDPSIENSTSTGRPQLHRRLR